MISSQKHPKIITRSNSSPLYKNLTRFILIYLLNIQVQAQNLVYSNFFGNFIYQNDWKVESGTGVSMLCGTSMIFGGHPNFKSNTRIIKTIELLPHTSLSINFKFWHIDNWGGEKMQVRVDNHLVYSGTFNSECTSSSICGHSGSCWGDGENSININITHIDEIAQIIINGYESYWGISEFELWTQSSLQGCNSYNIQNRFNQTYLIQQFDQKLFYQSDRLLEKLVILTFSSCFEQQKMISQGDYIMQERSFYNYDTICISLKQLSTISNPYFMYLKVKEDLVIISNSSNQVSSELICNIQIFTEINILQYQNLLPIKLKIKANLVEGYYDKIINLNDFSLVILLQDYQDCLDQNKDPFDGCFSGNYDCVQGCSDCIRGFCIECINGWVFDILFQTCSPICGDQMVIFFEQCDDGNQLQYDGCFQCKFSCPLLCKQCQFGKCFQCLQNYNLIDNRCVEIHGSFLEKYYCVLGCRDCIRGICVRCQQGWEYDFLLQMCLPICGDLMVRYIDDCDDENQLYYNGCFQCKFSCPLLCKQCQFGKCFECFQNYYFIDDRCVEIHNYEDQKQQDQFLIYISNQSDQGNYYHKLLHDQFANLPIHNVDCKLLTQDNFRQFNHQCRAKLIANCLHSLFDKCLECQTFYKLSWNQKECIPKCDDGIMIEYEFCDDQNNLQFDGCYKCQSSCQLECKQCIEQQCLYCIDGWKIIDNKCYQICGDGKLAISSQEQCDDGNYNSNDGCYDCKFECDQNCFSCSTSNLCLFCENNFEMDENDRCKPICGDGIIVQGLEECEDFNDIQNDGCYKCMFQCEINCSKCIQGICQECLEGYDLLVVGCQKIIIYKETDYLEDQYKKLQCGDGNQSNSEQCDDGNHENYDGCSSNCKIEENWICNLEQPNSCFLQTKFSLIYQNQTFDHQFVQMQFSNQVKQISKFNFSQLILPEIISLSNDQYQITIYPVVDVQDTQFAIALFEFDILFLDSISIKPNLSISINSYLIDNNNMPVDLSTQTIQLQQPKVLSNDQINVANRFQAFGNALMIGLGATSILMLFFGDPQQSLEIFDTLQFQSYLKFVNVIYPQNIQIYFHSSDIVTVNPILITLKITDILQTIIQDNFINSIGKIQEYQINADLLINIQSQISQIGLIVILYIFLQFYPRVYQKYCFSSKFFYFISSSKSKVLETVGIKLYKLNRKIINLRKLYTMKGFIHLFYANAWDLLFKVFLFLTSNTQSGYRSIISQCICLGVLFSLAFSLCFHLKGLNKNLDVSKLRNEQHEGICLLKKLIFILILIDLQESDIYQCTMITLLIFGYIGFLLMIQQDIPNIELIGLIWMDAPVMLFTFTSLVYCSDFQNYLTTDQKILLGFVQIGILILGLLGPLIKLGIKLFRDLRKIYQTRKRKSIIKVDVKTMFIFDQIL